MTCSHCIAITSAHVVVPDDQVLHVLNEGSLKQLQSLQTIGTKRAQQIMTWRTLHGQFHEVGNNGI